MHAHQNHSNSWSILLMKTCVLMLCVHSVWAVSISSSLFPVQVFGIPETDTKIVGKQAYQQFLLPDPISIYEVDHDNPRHSKSSFPGDETGDSPFFYCPESDPENDIFAIDKMVLNPNPPHISYVFVFHAHGYFRESILESKGPFRMTATVRRDDRNGIDFTFEKDFCDFVSMMEMDRKSTICPPFQGNGTIHAYEFVDWGISEGNYSVKIDVRGNNKRVFCVQAWFDLTRRARLDS